MNVLITGGLGFVGSNVASMLLHNEDIDKIYIVDDNSIRLSSYYLDMDDKAISYVKADLSKGISHLPSDVDCVIHLAAKGNVVESIEEPLVNLRANVISTLNVLEYMKTAKVKKLIFSSTGGALMGNAQPPVNELSLPAPISPYGASKLSCEGYISAYASMYDIQSFILRFGNVYGPFSFHKRGVINRLVNSFEKQMPFTVFGDGSSTRDYIYSEDVSTGISKCIFSQLPYLVNTFHLATGEETSLLDLVDIFIHEYGYSVPLDFRPARTGEVYRNSADYSRALSSLGFRPSGNINSLMAKTISWFRSFQYA